MAIRVWSESRLWFPYSVYMEAMLGDFDYGHDTEWGVIPKPVAYDKKDKGGCTFDCTPDERESLLDLVLERCWAARVCNDDRIATAYAAWAWLRKNYADDIAARRRVGRLL